MASSVYQQWSVIAGETPTTAKWNLLGSNDASFNTGLGFNDGILAPRHFSKSSLVIQSQSGINYMQLGNMMIMWGQSATTNTGTNINFPVAFSATPSVTTTTDDSNNQTGWHAGVSSNSMTLKQPYAGTLTVHWIAVGPF